MNTSRRMFTAAVAVGLLLTTTPASAALPSWVAPPAVPVPKTAVDSVLRSVTVVAPNDVWVVGGWTATVAHTLAAHWDGLAWTLASTPDSDELGEYGLNAVDAVTTADVWAVGSVEARDGTAKTTPLLLHYDGVSWTEQPTPFGVAGELADVDMLTETEGWAVGTAVDRPVILHRTLGQWSSVLLPPLPAQSALTSVFAVSPTDAWAAGRQTVNGRSAGLVLHWDGLRWNVVTLPDAGGAAESLNDIAAASPTDVWAVGSMCTPICQSRVLHLTGGVWRTETASPEATLTAVVPFSPSDVWVFGQATATAPVLDHIEHWDGTAFTVDLSVPPIAFGHHPASALALAAAAADHGSQTMWTVGWVQGPTKVPHVLFRR